MDSTSVGLFSHLNEDLLSVIFSYCDSKTLGRAAKVCKMWNKITQPHLISLGIDCCDPLTCIKRGYLTIFEQHIIRFLNARNEYQQSSLSIANSSANTDGIGNNIGTTNNYTNNSYSNLSNHNSSDNNRIVCLEYQNDSERFLLVKLPFTDVIRKSKRIRSRYPGLFNVSMTFTLLHVAVIFNRLAFIKLLVHYFSPSIVNELRAGLNETAICWAYTLEYNDIKEYLLENGADVSLKDRTGWDANDWKTKLQNLSDTVIHT